MNYVIAILETQKGWERQSHTATKAAEPLLKVGPSSKVRIAIYLFVYLFVHLFVFALLAFEDNTEQRVINIYLLFLLYDYSS